jgi:serine/threonine protein phosphatase PrpC
LYRRIPLEFYGDYMGAFLDKPKTEKTIASGEGNGLRFGVASMQGWRVEMEDAHCAVASIPGNLGQWSFFAVFDGHAGARVSERCAKDLLNTIVQTEEFRRVNPESMPSEQEIQQGIREGFLSLDERIRQLPEVTSGEDKSGSTAVCVLISPENFFFANCGDSRAILVRSNKVHFATMDHKPNNPEEKQRIQNAGGSVMIQRVNGSLAVSRSLGDYDYKKVEGLDATKQLVSPEPEISITSRDKTTDEFIVLACDGVWDVMSNEELNTFIQHRLAVTGDLTKVCNEVIDNCLYKGSRDNMSIVIIALDSAPKVNPAMALQDHDLDEQLKVAITEYLDVCKAGEIDISGLVSHLSGLNLEGYPPGGIVSKRYLIDATFNEYLERNPDKKGSDFDN